MADGGQVIARGCMTVAKYITCNQLQNFFRVGPSGACLHREEWVLLGRAFTRWANRWGMVAFHIRRA